MKVFYRILAAFCIFLCFGCGKKTYDKEPRTDIFLGEWKANTFFSVGAESTRLLLFSNGTFEATDFPKTIISYGKKGLVSINGQWSITSIDNEWKVELKIIDKDRNHIHFVFFDIYYDRNNVYMSNIISNDEGLRMDLVKTIEAQ